MSALDSMSNFAVLTYLDKLSTIHERHSHDGRTTVHVGICNEEPCEWMVDGQLRLRARLAHGRA